MALFRNHKTFAGNFYDPMGLFGGKKKGSSAQAMFEYRPYSGARPPQPEYLRPTEKQLYEMLSQRSQGVGVGYDPQRREMLANLVKSELGKREEDELRSSRGALSAAGLSGNPRAYEATAGRVSRDIGRTLGDELSKIAIEDLGVANQEKREATGQFSDFNRFNFGQANRVADFDLDTYNSEEGNRARSFGINEDVRQYGINRGDEQFSDLTGSALALGDMYLRATNPTYAGVSMAANALRRPAGTGIGPTSVESLIQSSAGPGVRRYGPFRRNITR